MKRKSKSISKQYLAIKIYLEDLESIERILKNSAKKFKVETDEYEFTSIAELKNQYKNTKPINLTISAWEPYIYIELNKLYVRLYCDSDDTSSSGIYYRLDKILSSATRKPNFFYTYKSVFVISLFSLIPNSLINKIHPQALTLWKTLFILWFILVLRMLYIRGFNSSDINLVNKDAIQDFFSRNKDQIIVGLLNGAIGAILGVVLTVLAFRFKLLK